MYDNEFNKPLYDIPYYSNLNKKLDYEVGDYLRVNTNSPKLYSNDIRHQYVSALYARNKGADKAKLLGDLNEIVDFAQSGRNDTNIDKINNQIGIEYGQKYPNIPRNELLYLLLTDFDKNKQRRETELNK